MDIEFKNSKTKENLMRAFAGESQARNRYTIAAEQAREQGLYAVSNVFLFTADQERAHAQRFYELLGECAGETIEIDGGYPVDIANKTESLLEMNMKSMKRSIRHLRKLQRKRDFLRQHLHFYRLQKLKKHMGNVLKNWQSF